MNCASPECWAPPPRPGLPAPHWGRSGWSSRRTGWWRAGRRRPRPGPPRTRTDPEHCKIGVSTFTTKKGANFWYIQFNFKMSPLRQLYWRLTHMVGANGPVLLADHAPCLASGDALAGGGQRQVIGAGDVQVQRPELLLLFAWEPKLAQQLQQNALIVDRHFCQNIPPDLSDPGLKVPVGASWCWNDWRKSRMRRWSRDWTWHDMCPPLLLWRGLWWCRSWPR